MREMRVDTKQLKSERGDLLTCDYSILVGEVTVGDAVLCESYGALVRVRENGEEVRIPNITIRVARIDALMERLVRGGVTPSTVRDVVDDWLSCE